MDNIKDKIEMGVIALSKSRTGGDNYVIVLENESSTRRLSMLIGPAEAQYIGITLEQLKTKRPLTHDILIASLQALNAQIKYVYIHSYKDQVFISDICILSHEGIMINIDSRASDAIAIALKLNVPVYTNDIVLSAMASSENIYVSTKKTAFSDYTKQELEDLLKAVIEKEVYESAIRIREYLNHKNQS
jgi:uncharacterized protein